MVVGCGVAIAATKHAGAASWTGLLKLGVARCRELNPSLDEAWEQRLIGEYAPWRGQFSRLLQPDGDDGIRGRDVVVCSWSSLNFRVSLKRIPDVVFSKRRSLSRGCRSPGLTPALAATAGQRKCAQQTSSPLPRPGFGSQLLGGGGDLSGVRRLRPRPPKATHLRSLDRLQRAISRQRAFRLVAGLLSPNTRPRSRRSQRPAPKPRWKSSAGMPPNTSAPATTSLRYAPREAGNCPCKPRDGNCSCLSQ